ncbi:MAG TPA: hypothetical protein VM580_07185 [Labilithrix sp.]|nr:hypothetical protein [Labilithrix sp.]
MTDATTSGDGIVAILERVRPRPAALDLSATRLAEHVGESLRLARLAGALCSGCAETVPDRCLRGILEAMNRQTIEIGGAGDRVDVRYEPETGFVLVAYRDEVITEAEIAELHDKLDRHYKEGDARFLLIDSRRTSSITPEARKKIAQGKTGGGYSRTYMGCYGGASFAARAIANLLIRAVSVLHKELVINLAADEAAARDWLAAQRRTHLAEQAKNPR